MMQHHQIWLYWIIKRRRPVRGRERGAGMQARRTVRSAARATARSLPIRRRGAEPEGADAAEPRRTPAAAVDLTGLTGLVGYQLRRAQLAVFADFVATLGALELRPATFSVLVLVDANPGLSQAAIGDALGIQRTNFVPLVADLERRGLVSRTPSTLDRRAQVLNLTLDGRRLLKRAREPVCEHEQRIAATLGAAGRRQLLAMLEALSTNPNP